MVSINCCLPFYLFSSLFRCTALSPSLACSSSCFLFERLASSPYAFVASIEAQLLPPNELAILGTSLLPSPWYAFLLLLGNLSLRNMSYSHANSGQHQSTQRLLARHYWQISEETQYRNVYLKRKRQDAGTQAISPVSKAPKWSPKSSDCDDRGVRWYIHVSL